MKKALVQAVAIIIASLISSCKPVANNESTIINIGSLPNLPAEKLFKFAADSAEIGITIQTLPGIGKPCEKTLELRNDGSIVANDKRLIGSDSAAAVRFLNWENYIYEECLNCLDPHISWIIKYDSRREMITSGYIKLDAYFDAKSVCSDLWIKMIRPEFESIYASDSVRNRK